MISLRYFPGIKKDGWVSPIRQVLYDKGKSEFAAFISFGGRLERD
jgi:hypothetical protein